MLSRNFFRLACLFIVLMGLLFLTSCDRYKSSVANLEFDTESTENIDYTTVNMFSAPVPGQPDFIRVVFIHRREPGGVGRGGGTAGSSDTPDYKLTGVKWRHGATYYVQSRPDIDVNTIFANAFQTWNNAEPMAPIFTNSDTSILPNGASYGLNVDSVNTVSFGDISMYGSNAIAITQYVYYRRTRETVEFDEIYSSNESWTVFPYQNEDYVTSTSGPFDLPDVATHEHGHVFGLSDLYNKRDKYLTMYGYASPGETLKRTLGTGDILGIQKIY